MTFAHTPVLLAEVVNALDLHPGAIMLDGTIGGGGHAQAILERIAPGDSANGVLIGCDQDAAAVATVTAKFAEQIKQHQFIVIRDNFKHIAQYVEQYPALQQLNGALLDLGISSFHLDAAGRGFSFHAVAEPLDMRMDQRQPVTAADILNTWSQKDLEQMLYDYGEESNARRIAKAIVEYRTVQPLQQVHDLVECVFQGYAGKPKPKHHLATRTFQAVRIAVNQELEVLPQALQAIIALLQPGGRLAVITFHSLEDRIVKQQFVQLAKGCICAPDMPICICQHQPTVRLITKRPIIATAEELDINPRARSAKLRVIEKI